LPQRIFQSLVFEERFESSRRVIMPTVAAQ
jgi:hypothetical protein